MADVKNNDEKIGFKDLYAELWQCRNFELTHFWQRSVFLATFLLAVAAAYGKVVFEIFSKGDSSFYLLFDLPEWKIGLGRIIESGTDSLVNMHAMACFLCYLGIAFSILWQMMVKGSKYWYESYERGIDFFVNELKFAWNKEIDDYSKNGAYLPLHGWLNGPYKENSSIFSSRAYRYSVSSVNSMIGIIGVFCWLVMSFLHQMRIIGCRNNFSIGAIVALSLAISFLIFAVEYALLHLFCASGGNDE